MRRSNWAGLLALVFVFAGCKAGKGEKCAKNEDCATGLECLTLSSLPEGVAELIPNRNTCVDFKELLEKAELEKCLTFTRCKLGCPDGAKEIKDGLSRYCQKDGKKHGRMVEWYNENGPKKTEGSYKYYQWHGLRTGWYENGKKQYEMKHHNNKKHGLETWWDRDGKKVSVEMWEHGIKQ